MNVRKALLELQKLVVEGYGSLEVIGVHGASGVSYETGSLHVAEKKAHDDAGPLCDEKDGYQYVCIYLGN